VAGGKFAVVEVGPGAAIEAEGGPPPAHLMVVVSGSLYVGGGAGGGSVQGWASRG